ncbi:MAG: PKD domain-containing protein [Bacteroidales bacterium]
MKHFVRQVLTLLSITCFYTHTYGQTPVADFEANITEGCDIITVNFTDLSTNSPDSWKWDIYKNNELHKTYSKENPTIVFSNTGAYSVELTVSNNDGSDSEKKEAYITVYKSPHVGFLASPLSGCTPLTTNFTNISTSDSPITSYSWDFGDGNTSTSTNPNYTYNSIGEYSVSLSVTNEDGCSQTITKSDYISVQTSPIANFSIDTRESCSAPLTVSFNNTSTNANNFVWDFGDGTTSTEQNPSHTYTSEGVFSVSLTARNDVGCSHTLDSSNAIHINTFAADFSSSEQTICRGIETQFINESNLPVSSVEWDFGDGNTSTDKNPTHTYNSQGEYTVTLTAISAAGCTNIRTKEHYMVVQDLPEIVIQADDSIACAPPFTPTFSAPTTNISQWEWDFGNGSTSTEAEPASEYTNYGNYPVSLTITDNNSCQNSLTKSNYIRIQKPQADFTSDVTQGCLPLEVSFSDASTSESTITKWEWDFGDDTTLVIEDNGSGTYIWTKNGTVISTDSSSINPTHLYEADTGQYTVSLTITDKIGCTQTFTATDYIGVGAKPSAHIFAPETDVCYRGITEFEDTTSDSFANEWIWDYGDGTDPVTVNTPSHEYVYADTGTFDIKLIAGQYECYSDTFSKLDYITILPPAAGFTASSLNICHTSDSIAFTDTSILAETYTWTFGDGNTLIISENNNLYNWEYNGVSIATDTTSKDPHHFYTEADSYSGQLKVTNSNGCVDSLPIEVTVDSLLPGFTQNIEETCQHSSITFTDTTYTNFTKTNWEWDFDDGHTSTDREPTHQFTQSGTFDISLHVTNNIGCTDSITMQSHIYVHEVPNPAFTAPTTEGCAPLEIAFTESSTSTASKVDSVVSWMWNYNDGTTLEIEDSASAGYNWKLNGIRIATDTSQKNPTHTFTNRGLYDISLTVTDSRGCDTTLTKIDYIQPTQPHPGINIPSVTCFYDTIAFSNTSTGTDLSYTWDFGDTYTSTKEEPKHSYFVTADSVITVSLTATDKNSCDSTVTKNITITRPKALFTADTTQSDCPPFIPEFSDTSGQSNNTWNWNFGDSTNVTNNTSTVNNPQHSYNTPGIYDVTLIVSNTYGCVDTLTKENYIEVGGPTGSFTFSPTDSCAPAPISFNAQTQKAIEHVWVFDDGEAISDDETITYTYTEGRTYTPALVITDINECEQVIIAEEPLQIYEAQVDFSAPSIVCNEQIVNFENNTNSSHDITAWLWDFGDDTTSIKDTATHFYTYGTYSVSLTASINECDFTNEKDEYISVHHNPHTKFEAQNTALQFEEIQFTNTSDSLPVPVTTTWDFGDGHTDTTDSPTHMYNTDGIFTVFLEQYTVPECSDSYAHTITIEKDILLPNVFTPNNDGINDIYLEDMEIELQIVNRWGQELYSGTNGWDGTYNGEKVSAGTYFYIITLPDGTIKKGPVTVLRDN